MTYAGQVEVLLVEDDPNDVELTIRALRQNNIVNALHVVTDGAEALEFIFGTDRYAERDLRDMPRVILLDLKLPLLDGLEVLRRIRGDERTKTTPVVMLTSSAHETDVVESYRLGVNSYIVKPVDFAQFTESIKTIGMYWLLINKPPVTEGG